MIIDCVSDLHGYYPHLNGGDLLILAGDYTANNHLDGWEKFFRWLEKQQYRKKIVIAGNHDNFCTSWATAGTFTDEEFEQIYPGELPIFDYLCDSGTEFEYEEMYSPHDRETGITCDVLCYKKKKLKIWGSPWTLTFPKMNPHCKAFTVDTEEELAEKWALIPSDTDILITHSPLQDCLDKTVRNESVGSFSLVDAIVRCKNLRLHICGHIHEAYGQDEYAGIKFVNASYVNERYQPVNKPIRIIL